MPRATDEGNLLQQKAQTRRTCRFFAAWVALAAAAHPLRAQILETETARILKRGAIEVASNFEFQTAKDGREYAVPFAMQNYSARYSAIRRCLPRGIRLRQRRA